MREAVHERPPGRWVSRLWVTLGRTDPNYQVKESGLHPTEEEYGTMRSEWRKNPGAIWIRTGGEGWAAGVKDTCSPQDGD